MRLRRLEHAHTLGTKVFFALVRVLSRKPVPDVMKTLRYRPEFFGGEFGKVLQACMRGPSYWEVGERELFAAFTAKLEACRF